MFQCLILFRRTTDFAQRLLTRQSGHTSISGLYQHLTRSGESDRIGIRQLLLPSYHLHSRFRVAVSGKSLRRKNSVDAIQVFWS